MEEVKKQGTKSLFVHYKMALELVELGFNEKTFDVYSDIVTSGFKIVKKPTPRILFQQAFRFFREKYGLHYIICKNIQMDGYGYREVILIHYMEENENTIFKTYEEAEIACLVKLIEIAKEQNVK